MRSKKCESCGSTLFEVVPFKTTQKAIVEFVKNSQLPDRDDIISSRWLHSGFYCPNGCHTILVEYKIALPNITPPEAIQIGQKYSRKYHQDFLETHGAASRIAACVYCVHFGGVVVEDSPKSSTYRNPKLKPLCNRRVVKAFCRIPQIQALDSEWWYDKGQKQPECDYFEYDKTMFVFTYKDVTGWSEYP